MQNCISPFNFTFICFPKDPQGNFLLFQQKHFPHKNQLKWHLQKHQLKCHQQKWHPQKDQRTVTLIWLLMLSLLSVGKFYSSKAGKWFHFYQHLLLGLTKVERYVHFKEFIFLWLQGKIFLSESIKAALQIFTSPARVGWVTRFTDRWVNCCNPSSTITVAVVQGWIISLSLLSLQLVHTQHFPHHTSPGAGHGAVGSAAGVFWQHSDQGVHSELVPSTAHRESLPLDGPAFSVCSDNEHFNRGLAVHFLSGERGQHVRPRVSFTSWVGDYVSIE